METAGLVTSFLQQVRGRRGLVLRATHSVQRRPVKARRGTCRVLKQVAVIKSQHALHYPLAFELLRPTFQWHWISPIIGRSLPHDTGSTRCIQHELWPLGRCASITSAVLLGLVPK